MGRGARTDIPVARAATLSVDELRTQLRENLVERLGFDAYEVGGSLRDEQFGRDPKDIDVAIPGVSYEELFEKLNGEGTALPLEVHHDDGTTSLIGLRLTAPWTPREGIEIALAREEVSTGPRTQDFEISPIKPDELERLQSEQGLTREQAGEELMIRDCARRDWTVNAMARPLRRGGKLIDPFGGAADIEARLLRPVSPDTCRDDPLRTLRGISRIAHEGLDPTPEAEAQIRAHAHRLAHLSQEKIHELISKTLMGPDVGKALRFARDTGALSAALPEFEPAIGYEQRSSYHDLNCDEHILFAVERAAEAGAPVTVRLALLYHDLGKPMMGWSRPGEEARRFHAKTEEQLTDRFDPARFSHEEWSEELARQALNRQNSSNELKRKVCLLVREHMFRDDEAFEKAKNETRQRIVARRFIQRIGRANVEELMLVRRCDRAAKSADAKLETRESAFERTVREEMSSPVSVGELAINGRDLIALGVNPGEQLGEILRDLLDQVITSEDIPAVNRRSGRPPAELLELGSDRLRRRELPMIERWAVQRALAAREQVPA